MSRAIPFVVIMASAAVCLTMPAAAHEASAASCQAIFELDRVSRLDVKPSNLDSRRAQEILASGDSFEIVFDSIETLIDFQKVNPEFNKKLHDQTDSFVLELLPAAQKALLSGWERIRQSSMKAALEVNTINTMFLDTFIPWSYFARNTLPGGANGGFPSAAEVEARLDAQIFIATNDDGTVALRNRGYRSFMEERIRKSLQGGSALHVFRGTDDTEAAFIEFIGKFAKGRKCEECRQKLELTLKEKGTSFDPFASDEAFLRTVFSALYGKRPYFFTTPEPRWADHWGTPFQLEIQFSDLPEAYRRKTYVAADTADNLFLKAVVEIDFSVRTFEEALLLFSKTRIAPANTSRDTSRIELNGRPIGYAEDLRSAPGVDGFGPSE